MWRRQEMGKGVAQFRRARNQLCGDQHSLHRWGVQKLIQEETM